MNSNLSVETMRSLAFIRYLYDVGAKQSQLPDPLGATSILLFHDSVELFLSLACEQHAMSAARDTPFLKYFELLKEKFPPGLSQEASMANFNTARIELKHRGNWPSPLQIEAFRSNVTSFFEENTKAIFGIEFDDISMLQLVQCQEARASLEEAKSLLTKGETKEAIRKIDAGFAELIKNYTSKKCLRYEKSPFFTDRWSSSARFNQETCPNYALRKALNTCAEEIRSLISETQDTLTILTLGLDFRRYTRFQFLTAGPAGRGAWRYQEKEKPLSLDECRFCYDFVIESALHLQSFDFEVGPY